MNSRQLIARMSDVVNFAQLQKKIAPVAGWLSELEGYLLCLLAAEGPGVGEIVEIGSYLGRSTCFLAAGSKGAGREKITAVDHFQGSPEHQAGGAVESSVLLREGTTYHHFLKNLRLLGLEDHVTPIVGPSVETARTWNRPIRLLFIDADHSFEASKEDFERWSPFVVRCGLICFHDIDAWPGVTRFYNELIASTEAYTVLAAVQTIRVIQKR